MIINDVGPQLEAQAIKRIAGYLGYPFAWDSLAAAERDLRLHYAPFGNLSDAIWQALTAHSVRLTQGKYVPNYDPCIAVPFQVAASDSDLWAVYQQINCPILALRGESSDILSREVWQEMAKRNRHTQLAEIAATGHAPSLMVAEQVDLIAQFLAQK